MVFNFLVNYIYNFQPNIGSIGGYPTYQNRVNFGRHLLLFVVLITVLWGISATDNQSNTAPYAYFSDDNTGDNNYEAPPYQASLVQSPGNQNRFATAASFPVIEVFCNLLLQGRHGKSLQAAWDFDWLIAIIMNSMLYRA